MKRYFSIWQMYSVRKISRKKSIRLYGDYSFDNGYSHTRDFNQNDELFHLQLNNQGQQNFSLRDEDQNVNEKKDIFELNSRNENSKMSISDDATSISLTLTPISSSSGNSVLSKSFALKDLDEFGVPLSAKNDEKSEVTNVKRDLEEIQKKEEKSIFKDKNLRTKSCRQMSSHHKWTLKEIPPDTVEHFWHSSCRSWSSWDPTSSSSPSIIFKKSLSESERLKKSHKALSKLAEKFNFDIRTFAHIKIGKSKFDLLKSGENFVEKLEKKEQSECTNVLGEDEQKSETASRSGSSSKVTFLVTSRSSTSSIATLKTSEKESKEVEQLETGQLCNDHEDVLDEEKEETQSSTLFVEEDEMKGTKLIVKHEYVKKEPIRPAVEFRIASVQPSVERLSDDTLHRLFFLPNAVITPPQMRSTRILQNGQRSETLNKQTSIDTKEKKNNLNEVDKQIIRPKTPSKSAINFNRMLLYLFN